jgi:hypothetical protein
MRKKSLLVPLLLVLAACSASGQPSSPSADGGVSPDASPPDSAGSMPDGAGASDTAPMNSLKGSTIEVARDGTPLKVEPMLRDFDYGYQRDFVFGKYTVAELATMADDEVGVVFTDGNLYNNSSAIKLRLNLSQGRIFEVAGGPSTPNTEQHPGVTTKELSADKNTLLLYTYRGKMLDTGNGRAPTTESFSVTIRNLDVRRP